MNINDLEKVSKEWLEEASETTPAAILELIAAGKRLAVRLNGKSVLVSIKAFTTYILTEDTQNNKWHS